MVSACGHVYNTPCALVLSSQMSCAMRAAVKSRARQGSLAAE
jgi:hypothetical protein